MPQCYPAHRRQAVLNLIQGCSGQFRHLESDPIVTMTRVASLVAVDPVPHVQQFLSHDDFKRFWP